jgi:hypothetical protein
MIGLAGFVRRLFGRSLPSPLADSRALRVLVVLLLFLAAPILGSLILIYPRDHYLLLMIVFGCVAGFAGYTGFPRLLAWCRWLDSGPALAALALLLAAFMPNWAHPWSVQQLLGHEPIVTGPTSMEVQRTVAVMRGLGLPPSETPISVLESDYARAFYAGWNFHKVDHWTKTESFWQFMAVNDIAVVVLNERLLTDTRFRDDPEFVEFATERKVGRFHFFAVPGTTVRLAVREELLPHPGP